MYSRYHDHVISHVYQLVTFLENLEAKEEERVWLKRQADGELDESRLSEGLTGEPTVYKRRGLEKRALLRPERLLGNLDSLTRSSLVLCSRTGPPSAQAQAYSLRLRRLRVDVP